MHREIILTISKEQAHNPDIFDALLLLNKEGCLSDADLFSANDMRLTEKQREDFLRNKKFVEEVFDSQ